MGIRKWVGTCGNPFKVFCTFWLWRSSRVVANSIMPFSGHWSLVACTHLLTRKTYRDILRLGETTCWGNHPCLAGSQVFAVFQTLMSCRRSEPQLFGLRQLRSADSQEASPEAMKILAAFLVAAAAEPCVIPASFPRTSRVSRRFFGFLEP